MIEKINGNQNDLNLASLRFHTASLTFSGSWNSPWQIDHIQRWRKMTEDNLDVSNHAKLPLL